MEPGNSSWRGATVYAVNPKKGDSGWEMAGREAAKPLQICCLIIQEIEGRGQERPLWDLRHREDRDLSSSPDRVTE